MSRHPTKRFERRPPGEQTESPDAKDADWGFEHHEPERVLDPKLGIILITALLLMFGFVFYQKLESTTSEDSQASAGEGEGQRTSNAGEDDLPIGDGASFVSQSDVQIAQSASPADAGMYDPFLASESSPPGRTKLGRTAKVGRTSRARVTEEVNPFASSANPFAEEPDQAAPPPPQSEPSPFGEPAQEGLAHGEPAEHDYSPFGSAESLEEERYFEVEPASPPSQKSSGGFDTDPWPGDGRASSRPSGESHRRHRRTVQQFEVGPPDDPNPFAAPPPSRERSFDSHRRDSDQHEPQAFPSDGFAAPIPPQQQEPDPFGFAESPSRGREEAAAPTENPFFDPPARDRQAPGASGWETVGEPQVNHPRPHKTRGLGAPELPGLPAPTKDSSTLQTQWDLSPTPQQLPALPPVEGPHFQSMPTRSQRRVPSGESFAGGQVPVVGEHEVRVQKKDSLWSISREAYGTGKYVAALARYNRDRVPHPNKLRVGVKIRIPPPEVLESQFPDLFGGSARRDASVASVGGTATIGRPPQQIGIVVDSAGRPYYRAGKNDTLFEIARRYLGRASRWTEILDMNRHQLKNAESLKPGMVLRMPADAGSLEVFNGRPPSR